MKIARILLVILMLAAASLACIGTGGGGGGTIDIIATQQAQADGLDATATFGARVWEAQLTAIAAEEEPWRAK